GLAAVRLLDTSAAIDAAQGDFPRALEKLDRALISLNIVSGTATDAKNAADTEAATTNAASMETNAMKAIIMESTAKAAMELRVEILNRRTLYRARQPFIRNPR
ncbi:MAG: hypothetical protein ACKO38_20515, partial [Planctomycetota bacterium]